MGEGGGSSAPRHGTNSSTATWRGGWRCDVQAGDFTLAVDEPEHYGGSGEGPMPTDLFLAALSSCYTLSLGWAARKRGIDLPDLEVTATGRYEGQRFAELTLTVRSSARREVLEPLLEPATRVCYVSQTLRLLAPVTVEIA